MHCNVELAEPLASVQQAVERVWADPFPMFVDQACACEPPAAPGAVERRHVPDDALVMLMGAGVRAGLAVTPAGWPLDIHGST